MKYDYKKTLIKALKYGVMFALPWAIDQFIVSYPQYAQLTVGAILVALANWLKHYVGVKFL